MKSFNFKNEINISIDHLSYMYYESETNGISKECYLVSNV